MLCDFKKNLVKRLFVTNLAAGNNYTLINKKTFRLSQSNKRLNRTTMKKTFLLSCVVMVMAMMFSSCAVNLSGVTANYARMSNFYVNNHFPDGTHKLVLHNQQDFESVFGEGAVMGKNGMPTKVDFRHQFVVAVVLPETNRQTTIETALVNRVGDRLYFSYIIDEGHSTSYTMRPFTAVVVDRNEPSDVVFQRVTRQDLQNAGIQYTGGGNNHRLPF